MQAIEEINFQAYLKSVLDDTAYSDCRHFYAPTDGVLRPKIDLRVRRYQSPKQETDREPGKNKEILSILDGLRKYQAEHVLLVGKPGSGKSTALERLLFEEAGKALSNPLVKVPVLVRLRQYQTSVLDLVRDFLMGHGARVGQLEQLLHEGKFLLLLDGVNELPHPAARTNLESFCFKFRKTTPMILTTRDLNLGGTAGVEHRLEMESLTVPQMEEFVKAYLPEQHKKMLPQMGDRLRKFSETPLFLVMLCDVFEKCQRIPENLGKAFRDFTQIYDIKLRDANVPTHENSHTVWAELLQHLAFVMMQGDSSTDLNLRITKQRATALIQEQFHKTYHQASLWLEDLLKYHLIQEFNSAQIEFRHQLIQEYYAAEYLLPKLENTHPETFKRDYLNHLKWTEPISIMLGLLENRERVVKIVVEALEIDLILGAKLAGSAQEKFHDETVNLVINEQTPISAKIELLQVTRSDVAVPILLEELKKGRNSNFSFKAAFSLWVIGSPASTQGLLEILDFSDDLARQGAIFTLEKNNLDGIVYKLINLLKDPCIDIQKYAAKSLGNIGNSKAVSALIQELENPSPEVCAEAASALGKLEDLSSFEPLMRVITRDQSASGSKALLCQWSAANSLGKLDANLAFERLIEVLKNQDYNLCKRAADAIEHLESEEIIPQLLTLMDSRYDLNYPYICWSAAKALSEIGNKTAIPGLVQALKNSCTEVRRSAAYVLETLGDETVIPALVEALEDKDYSVRQQVALALGTLGNEASIPELTKALNQHNGYIDCKAAELLGKIGNKDVVPTLLQVLETSLPDQILYCYAAAALGKLDEEKAIPYLFAALKNNNSWECRQVVDCLSFINTHEVITQLCEILGNDNEDSKLRKRAAEILGRLGGENASTKLREALSEPNTEILAYVVEALGNAGDFASLPRLWQMQLDNEDTSFLSAINTIQSHVNCKFYKHFSEPLSFQSVSESYPMRQKSILRVVVASPGDVQAERDLLPGIIDELNRGIAADRNLSIELTRWETDAYPGFHPEGPQGLIDSVLKIEECDILIGVFWKRFGTPVKDANSGTEHEFLTAYESWKQKDSPQIMVYFNQMSYSPSSSRETEQWTQVLKFKESFPEEGLWWKYEGEADFERKVRNHLTQFIRNHHPSTVQSIAFSENPNMPSGNSTIIYNINTIGNFAHNVQGNQTCNQTEHHLIENPVIRPQENLTS